jgi:HK97 family phage major capsid protein
LHKQVQDALKPGFDEVKGVIKQTTEELSDRLGKVEEKITTHTEEIQALNERVSTLESLPDDGQGSSAKAGEQGKASKTQRRAAPSREHKASLVVFSKANQTASEDGLLERKSLARRLAYRETKGDFSRFVKALREGDSMAVKALGGVTDTAGGFLVPTEHLAVLARIVEEYGWGRRLATVVPMASDTLNVPKLSTAVTASWVAEAAAAPDADPAFAQKQLTAKEGRFKTIVSNALLEDSSPAIDAILLDLFGEAWAKMEDEAVFNGAGSGDSDPFTGILNDTDVNSVAAAGTTLAYDDLVALEAALTGGARRNAWIYVSRKGFKHLRLIKDSNGQPLWTDNIQDGTLGMVLGYPVAVLEAGIPDNLGAGTDETVFILGSLKNVYVGDRAAFSVKSSEHVRFENDQTVIMGRVREAITVVNPEGFAKLTGVVA